MSDEGLRIVRVHEAARQLGVDRSTLWRWVRDGVMPAPLKIGPAARGWQLSTLLTWLSQRGGK